MPPTAPTDEAIDLAKTLSENSARYDYTGTTRQDHYTLVPLPRILDMVGEAMVGDAQRIAKTDTSGASEQEIGRARAIAAKIGRIGKQLKQITNALTKIKEGRMPDAGELRALKGDPK